MIKIVYRYFIYPLIEIVFYCYGLFSKKAQRTRNGRSNNLLQPKPNEFNKNGLKIIHFHSASVGEFEQAKPIIENLKKENSDLIITVSFFSISGYEQQSNYKHVNKFYFLPSDSISKTKLFLNNLSPDIIVIMRYDLWYEFLNQAKLLKIPIILVCATLKNNSIKFCPFIKLFFIKLYSLIEEIHCAGLDDYNSFRKFLPNSKIFLSGETRYDRVIQNSKSDFNISQFIPEKYLNNKFIIVAGSTWKADEKVLSSIVSIKNLLLVIVPHEPTESNVTHLKNSFKDSRTLEELSSNEYSSEINVVIFNRTGVLPFLYRIASVSYVGGGFGNGVHSTLEPISYGLPVITGPKIFNSRDAQLLNELRILTVIKNQIELRESIEKFINNADKLIEVKMKSKNILTVTSNCSLNLSNKIGSLISR